MSHRMYVSQVVLFISWDFSQYLHFIFSFFLGGVGGGGGGGVGGGVCIVSHDTTMEHGIYMTWYDVDKQSFKITFTHMTHVEKNVLKLRL